MDAIVTTFYGLRFTARRIYIFRISVKDTSAPAKGRPAHKPVCYGSNGSHFFASLLLYVATTTTATTTTTTTTSFRSSLKHYWDDGRQSNDNNIRLPQLWLQLTTHI